jgi:hypothetical protein
MRDLPSSAVGCGRRTGGLGFDLLRGGAGEGAAGGETASVDTFGAGLGQCAPLAGGVSPACPPIFRGRDPERPVER